MEDFLLLVWVFSCVIAWGFTSSATSLGETIHPSGYKWAIRTIGYIASSLAILTTITLLPKFSEAIQRSQDFGNTLSFLLWSTIHLSGAIYTVIAFNYKLAHKTIALHTRSY